VRSHDARPSRSSISAVCGRKGAGAAVWFARPGRQGGQHGDGVERMGRAPTRRHSGTDETPPNAIGSAARGVLSMLAVAVMSRSGWGRRVTKTAPTRAIAAEKPR